MKINSIIEKYLGEGSIKTGRTNVSKIPYIVQKKGKEASILSRLRKLKADGEKFVMFFTNDWDAKGHKESVEASIKRYEQKIGKKNEDVDLVEGTYVISYTDLDQKEHRIRTKKVSGKTESEARKRFMDEKRGKRIHITAIDTEEDSNYGFNPAGSSILNKNFGKKK